MDEGIIDIRKYMVDQPNPGPQPFSIWGGEAERAGLALPVWRSLHLAGAERGGIVRQEVGSAEPPAPVFVLDLGEEEARTFFPPLPEEVWAVGDPPALFHRRGGGILVFLGEEEGKRWFLEVSGVDGSGLNGKKREDLLFLAGECAGLLFLRRLVTTER